RGSRGKASSTHFVSCRQTMSGCRASSQETSPSRRCLTELTFQVATSMAGDISETGVSAKGRTATKRRNSPQTMGFVEDGARGYAAARRCDRTWHWRQGSTRVEDQEGARDGWRRPGGR